MKFDGINDSINFTRETLPAGAFTIDFEIKQEHTGKTQVLCRHFNRLPGSVSLFLRRGKLYACFGQKDLKAKNFSTGLAIPFNEWSHVTVRYDLKQLSFTVNGRTQSFPMTGRAYTFKPLIFGGHTKGEYAPKEERGFIKGLLRRLESRHF